MSKSAVINNLAKLYADKRAHIADWAPPVKGGQTAGIWVKGPGKNAPRRTISHGTIERAKGAGPRSPFADLFDLAGDAS
jgi:hypothetical protein